MLARRFRLPAAALRSPRGERLRFAFGSAVFVAGHSGYAVVVSKKLSKTAVRRNRIRRRIYRALARTARAGKPHGVIIYPTLAALTAPFSDLENALVALLSRPPARRQS